eukprot:scaffold33021_cov30-Prasinocladus_malaysianus.AAC.1
MQTVVHVNALKSLLDNITAYIVTYALNFLEEDREILVELRYPAVGLRLAPCNDPFSVMPTRAHPFLNELRITQWSEGGENALAGKGSPKWLAASERPNYN